MSNLRHDEGILVRTYGVTFNRNELVPPVSETWDQLVYATKGVLTIRTELDTWIVPPYRALWLPAGTACVLQVVGKTALRMLYLRRQADLGSFERNKCAVLSVTPLLRELILRAVSLGALREEVSTHQRLAGLIQDEIQLLDTVPLQLPYPRDAAAVRLSSLVDSHELTKAIQHCGVGRRTLERTFRIETGMSLGQWVRRRKLLTGLQLLAEGETTSSVAFQLGYNSPSAFIAMFKRELGSTPSAYLSSG